MCFSEKLADCAHAYQTQHGWVYRAWKAVAVGDDGTLRPLYRPTIECDYGESRPGAWGSYTTGKLLRDRHGYHVGASPKGAMVAALQFAKYGSPESRRVETALQAWRRLESLVSERSEKQDYTVRLVRCLIPSAGIGEGHHAHSLLMLPPGQRETEALVELADRENRRLARALNERDLAISKLRKIAAGTGVLCG